MKGKIVWTDLTVENANDVKSFYEQVAGWQSEPVSMGDYSDYSMKLEQGDTVAGICHSTGCNEAMPPVWMMYISVADLQASIDKCLQLGGEVLLKRTDMPCAVIKDPAGAICALYQES